MSTGSSYGERMDFDPLHVAAEVWAVTMWSNLLFFCAHATVGQTLLYYAHRERLSRRRYMLEDGNDSGDSNTEDANNTFVAASWTLHYSTVRGYLYTALGAGLGSMVWPGWGTLVGVGFGDAYGQALPVPKRPEISRLTWDPVDWFSKLWKLAQDQRGYHDDDLDIGPSFDTEQKRVDYNEARLCGCCQIVAFSANPNNRDRAPISSRSCGHSICKSCVSKCHLMLMERKNTYEEWIKCPLCNAARAFSSHDHLINRSLCDILAWIDDKTI